MKNTNKNRRKILGMGAAASLGILMMSIVTVG